MQARCCARVACLATFTAFVACGTPPPAKAPLTAAFAACTEAQGWTETTPKMTPDVIYGVGRAEQYEDALDAARVAAAKIIGVEVEEETSDTQVLWMNEQRGLPDEHSSTTLKRAARSFVSRRMESCRPLETCRSGDELVSLVSCERKTGLERELTKSARQLAEVAAGAPVRILAVPGTDADGFITQLGLYMSNVLRDYLAAAKESFVAVVDPGPWKPVDLHEAARSAGASHLLRVEYIALEGDAVRVTAYLQDVASDQRIPRSTTSFEVQLNADQASLLSIRGSLLPQRDAHNLVSVTGTYQVPLRMQRTELREGDELAMNIKTPRAGHLYLFDIYEDGTAAVLIPSRMLPDNRVDASTELRIPRAGDVANLVACAGEGKRQTREYLKVFLSPVPLSFPSQATGALGITLLHGGPDGGLDHIVTQLNDLQSEEVELGTGELTFLIHSTDPRASACVPTRP